ncbi:MAG: hypothetical protein QM630_03525 [Microbacterium sp.]
MDNAKALAGNRSNTSATNMVAASAALHALLVAVAERGRFQLDDLDRRNRERITS